MENLLEDIHSTVCHDNVKIEVSKEEILSRLWTMLGGSRPSLGTLEEQLGLLRQAGEQRKTVRVHVTGALLKLQGMAAELQMLRERITSAGELRDRGFGMPTAKLRRENLCMVINALGAEGAWWRTQCNTALIITLDN